MRKRLIITVLILICLVLSACSYGNGMANDADKDNGQSGNGTDYEEDKTPDGGESMTTKIKISIKGMDYTAELNESETVKAFIKLLPMTVTMSEMPHEKYYYLPSNLPTAATNIKRIQTGDIMLWGSNCLVLFYESFSTSYSYTKIGKIVNTRGLATAVGSGSVTVTYDIME